MSIDQPSTRPSTTTVAPLAGDRAPEALPQSWDDARDTAFFTLTARLFSPATALAMTVLLASYDDDAAPVAADGRG